MKGPTEPLLLHFCITLILLICVSTLGCGGAALPTSAPNVISTAGFSALPSASLFGLIPASPTLVTGQSVSFAVPFIGSPVWSVNGVQGGDRIHGTIDSEGNYTAPKTAPGDPVTVTARAGTMSTAPVASTTVSVLNPSPHLDQISPGAFIAGSGSPLLVITGSGFNAASQVSINGQTVATTYISAGKLSGNLPDVLTQSATTFDVAVVNPAPGGGISAPQPLTILSTGQIATTGNPQVAAYSIFVPDKSLVSVDFGVNSSYGLATSQLPAPPGGGTVRVLVAGMKSNSSYHMRAVLQLAGSEIVNDNDKIFQTGSLPSAQMPSLRVTQSVIGTESPGVQILNGVNTSTGYPALYAVDREGNVIWSYFDPVKQNPPPVKLAADGNFVLANAEGVLEVNLAGEIVRTIPISTIQAGLNKSGYGFTINTLHHDLEALPNNHLLLFADTTQNVTLAGTSSPQSVNGDVVIDLDPNLSVPWVWNEFDHLDVNRHPLGEPDWTHSNGLVYLPRDGNLLVSMRSQSWIVKVDYRNGTGTGDILWRLGYQGDFSLSGGMDPTDWFWMQHDPSVVADQDGTMILTLFDNGDDRIMDSQGESCGSSAQPPCYSRAVLFALRENPMVANLNWQANPGLYSFWGGSVQQASNGNIIADFNDLAFGSRVIEFAQNPSADVVWQLDVFGQNEYRSTRLPSLYPGITWP